MEISQCPNKICPLYYKGKKGEGCMYQYLVAPEDGSAPRIIDVRAGERCPAKSDMERAIEEFEEDTEIMPAEEQ